MITESILNMFFSLINVLLDMIPDITISIDTNLLNNTLDFVATACYFLPMDTVALLFGIVCTVLAFRIIVALCKLIILFIPGM